MKKLLSIFILLQFGLLHKNANCQIINPGFETWSNDMLVPSAMNPNTGNNTYGWWDFNFFNSSFVGSSPISVTRCTDTVRTGSYSARIETKVYTPTSWNIYKSWGIPFIGHEYNDTLGILFNGKVNLTDQTYKARCLAARRSRATAARGRLASYSGRASFPPPPRPPTRTRRRC